MAVSFIIFSKNKPGVLYKIADLFLRRKINIESLTVAETQIPGISCFTIAAEINWETAEKVEKQIYRIIEVIKVSKARDSDLIFKEVALIKVFAKNPQKRREIEDVSHLFKARIDYVRDDFLVIEKTGTEQEIQSLISLLRPFGIKGFARSGRIALLKKEEGGKGKFREIIKRRGEIAESIEVSAIKQFEILISKERDSVSLAQGIPSFETPPFIREKAKEAIDKSKASKYTKGWGIQELREVLAEKVKRENKILAKPENIIVTHGAIEALMATFLALCDPKDEILVLSPDYASHITQIRIARHGAKPIFVPLEETREGWKLNPEKLESAISPKTKVILICNPSNPLGKVYSFEELKQIAEIALRHNLFVIADEVYEYFLFDSKKHISVGSFPELADRAVSVFSFSKSYSMTGWRIGYLVAERKLVQEIFKVHDSLITCPVAVSQYAALAAVKEEGGRRCIEKFKRKYEKRRKIGMEILTQTEKLSAVKPEGAYYFFPKLNIDIDDYQFSLKLLKEAKVGVVPGSAFGPGGEKHIRISFGLEEKKLKEGLERLINYLKKF